MKSITFILIFLLTISCTGNRENSRRLDKVETRGVEANSEFSSILITINRELRIGYEYYLKGNFTRALRVYKKAVRSYMKYDYRHRLATVYSNIGTIFLKINNLKQAEEYLVLSIKFAKKHILKESNRKKLLAVNYNKLSLLYLQKNKFKKSKSLNDKSYKINLSLNSTRGISKNYRVYGLYFYKRKKIKVAAGYFIDASQFNVKTGDYYDLILNYKSIADILLSQKKYKKALAYYYRSLNVAKRKELNEKISILLYSIGIFYEKQKKYADALRYYKRAYECDLNLEMDDGLRKIRERNSLNKIQEMYNKLNKPNEINEYKRMIKFFFFTNEQN